MRIFSKIIIVIISLMNIIESSSDDESICILNHSSDVFNDDLKKLLENTQNLLEENQSLLVVLNNLVSTIKNNLESSKNILSSIYKKTNEIKSQLSLFIRKIGNNNNKLLEGVKELFNSLKNNSNNNLKMKIDPNENHLTTITNSLNTINQKYNSFKSSLSNIKDLTKEILEKIEKELDIDINTLNCLKIPIRFKEKEIKGIESKCKEKYDKLVEIENKLKDNEDFQNEMQRINSECEESDLESGTFILTDIKTLFNTSQIEDNNQNESETQIINHRNNQNVETESSNLTMQFLSFKIVLIFIGTILILLTIGFGLKFAYQRKILFKK
ncbi:hypothetical protein HERIO_1073 [Hepatospora eriocheir]|uniref:Uncharacterized protein n=1 Tax=Hepatospora eriocheir TaxID=1081669 RepID=A0A1X0QB70_9MICR|nr:hypothetical protein HERIO_1073 [Hepatospora eriocheir]